MTIRFSGAHGARSVAPVRLASPLLVALVSGGLFSCSAASPTPTGGKASGTETEQPSPASPAPAALPEGVMETTNAEGEPVFVDMMGNPVPTMTGVDDMGMPTTTITDPNTGMQVPVTPVAMPSTPAGG